MSELTVGIRYAKSLIDLAGDLKLEEVAKERYGPDPSVRLKANPELKGGFG